MTKAVAVPVVLLAAVVVLWAGLVESQCTTRHCEDGSENDPLSVSLRNQDVIDELWQAVGRLQEDVAGLKEALVKHNKPHLGRTRPDAATSCRQILDNSSSADNGVYWICASRSCKVAREVFCDMRSGGWTLIGQIGGVRRDIQNKWLVTNENTAILRTPVIENGTYGCIDAVEMAVNYAHEVRLSSGESATGMGQYWVEWDLPADRDVDTFWRHSVDRATIVYSTHHKVEVRSALRRSVSKNTCQQNKYGVSGYFGGMYPSTSMDVHHFGADDVCMGVPVVSNQTQAPAGVYFVDAPADNSDWPNAKYKGRPPFVSVWLN